MLRSQSENLTEKEHIALDKERIALDKKQLIFDKAVLMGLFGFLLIGATGFAYYMREIRAKTGEQIFNETASAVVRIGVRYGGTITIPNLVFDDASRKIAAGTTTFDRPITTVLLGTGFIVNPRGYIVTNAHVVDVSDVAAKKAVYDQFAFDNYLNLKQSLPNLDEETLGRLFGQIIDVYNEHGLISNLTQQIAIFNPDQKDGTIAEYIDKGFQVAKPKKIGEPFPSFGKDLAILKVDRPEDLPALKLGDSDKVRQGSKVYVIGYPGVADLNDAGNIKATLTSGIVSAIRKSDQGDYNVIQVDAAIAPGNSGGPALDDRGRVIGVATFGVTEGAGYNWILPINLGKEFLDELNVKYSFFKTFLGMASGALRATTSILLR